MSGALRSRSGRVRKFPRVEELAQDIVQSLPFPALLLDHDGQVLGCSDTAQRLLQIAELTRFNAEAMLAQGWSAEDAESWLHCQQLAAGESLIMVLLHEGRGARCRLTLRRMAQSSWLLVQVHASSLGEATHLHANALLRSTLEQAPVGVMIVDAQGTITLINAQMRGQIGLSEADVLLGQNALEPLNPEAVRSATGRILPVRDWPLSRALKDGESTEALNLLCLRRDGKSVWRTFAAAPVLEAGQIRGAVLLSRDITAEHEMSQLLADMNLELSEKSRDLEKREALLEAALDQAPVLVHMVQTEGLRTLMLNAFGRNLLGIDEARYRSDIWHQPIDESQAPRFKDMHQAAVPLARWPVVRAARGETVDEELLLLERNDETHRLLCSAVPVRSPSGDAIGAIMLAVDLTERQKEEDQRQRLLARVKEAERLESIGILAGQLAHELNNILATIMGHADLAMCQIDEAHPVQADLAAITRATERAGAELAQSLRITGQALTMKEPVDVGALVRDEISRVRHELSEDIHLIVDVAPDLPAVRADRAGLRQMVLSLFSLARRDLAECMGEILIAVRDFDSSAECEPAGQLIEGISAEGRYVELTIVDDGAGAMISELQRAFDPVLARAANPELDLAIVRGTVRAHKGLIFAETAPQRGMRTTVLLPIDRS